MKKHKKQIIISAVAVVLIAGVVFGVVAARKNSRRAYVENVGDLNMALYGDFGSSYTGSVYESAQQKIFAGSDKVVEEVYVKTGDQVKKGDKLFSYDTTLLELDVEEKELSVTICENDLTTQQAKLTEYKNIVPYVETAVEEVEEIAEEEAAEAVEDEAADSSESEERQYTAQEKADLITDQELVVKKAENTLKSANQDLLESQEALENATVTAQLDGTVTEIKSPAEQDNTSAFCTIVGNSGVTVKGYVGEFDLQTLSVGDTLTVSSWMTGNSTSAEVLTVADYPTDAQVYADGNTNTSYYEFTAYMDDAEGFDIGEDVQISKMEIPDGDQIIIDKMYVRTDERGSYVMKDEDGVLKRQDVKAQKAGSDYVLITEGLTDDDMIAFPYGSLSKEGLLTTTEQSLSLF